MADVPARVFGVEAPTFRAGPAGSNLCQLHDYPAHTNDDSTRVNHSLLIGTWLLSPLATVATQTAVPAAPSTPVNRGWRDNGYMHPAQGSVQTRITGTWNFLYEMQNTGVNVLQINFTVIAYAISDTNVGRELFRNTAAAILLPPGHSNVTQSVSPGTIVLNPGEILQYEFYEATLVSVVGTTRFNTEAASSGAFSTPQVDVPEITAFTSSGVDGGGALTAIGVATKTNPITTDTGGALVAVGSTTHTGAQGHDTGGALVAVGSLTRSSTIVVDGSGDSAIAGVASRTGAPSAMDGGGAPIGVGHTALNGAIGQAVAGGEITVSGSSYRLSVQGFDGGGELGVGGINGRRVALVATGGGGVALSAGVNSAAGAFVVDGGGQLDAIGRGNKNGTQGIDGGGVVIVVGQASKSADFATDGGGLQIVQGFVAFAPTIGPVAGGGNFTAVGIRQSGCDELSQQRIAPDAIIGVTNLSGSISDINDDPDSDDGDWLVAAVPVENTYVETSFFTPSSLPHGPQRMRVRVRSTEVVSGPPLLPPTVRLEVAEFGVVLARTTELAAPTNYPSGDVVLLDWDASQLADPTGANVQLRVYGTAAVSGMFGRTVEVGGEAWLVGAGCTGMAVETGGDTASTGNRHACFAFEDRYGDTYTDVYGQTFSPCGPLTFDQGGALVAVARKEIMRPAHYDGGGAGGLATLTRSQSAGTLLDQGGALRNVGQRFITIGPLGGGGELNTLSRKGGRSVATHPGGGASMVDGVAVRALACILRGHFCNPSVSGSVGAPTVRGTVTSYTLRGVTGKCGHCGGCGCG